MPQTTDAFSVAYPVKCPGVGMGEQGDEPERGCAPQGPCVLKQSLIKPSQEWKLHTQAWGGLEDKAIFIFLTVLANLNVQMDNVW